MNRRVEARSAVETRRMIAEKKMSALETVNESLGTIEKLDKDVRAFLDVDFDGARAKARSIDERLARGERVGKLAGIPVAVKDNITVKNRKCTCSSKILENFVAPYDAHVVERLEQEGAVIVGKTNLDEFAMGSSCENSAFFPTHNPWDLERAPGGSSGGSAAAVAAGMVPLSLGSDTGGSIRQPASFCGIVGLKPTYGRISRYGLVAFASSLDQVGPFARNVEDAALLLECLSGHDHRDSTSVNRPVPAYTEKLAGSPRGLRFGLPKEFLGEGMEEGVRKVFMRSIEKLREQGATIVDVSLPHSEYAIATYYILATSEASSNLARYDGVHYGHRSSSAKRMIEMYSQSRAEGFGAEVKRRIILGTFCLSSGYYDAYYLKAQKVRRLIKQDFDRVWEQADFVIAPTSPTVAFKIGERTDDPLAMYLSDIYTISVNLAGLPGLSLNCGMSDNLPVGLQLIGKSFDEENLLRAAHACENICK